MKKMVLLTIPFFFLTTTTGCMAYRNFTVSIKPTGGSETIGDAELVAQSVYQMINGYRNSKGLPDLKWDSTLANIAEKHSFNQGIDKEIYHQDLDRVSSFTGYSSLAENVAYNNAPNTAEVAVRGWVNSSGHNANILNPKYIYTGVGVARQNGIYYYTQLFGY